MGKKGGKEEGGGEEERKREKEREGETGRRGVGDRAVKDNSREASTS